MGCRHPVLDARFRPVNLGDRFLIILMKTKKNVMIVGDRVQISIRTKGRRRPRRGSICRPRSRRRRRSRAGPWYAIPETTPDESWKAGGKEVKYLPLQAKEGDYAIFLKDAAMEIEFEEKKYLIVPHSAILALVRTELEEI